MKQRLDRELVARKLVATRSQAEDMVRRGFVLVDGEVVMKPGFLVGEEVRLKLLPKAQFVSRAGEKLFSVVKDLHVDFRDKTVLDVGSSTGGFTEVALQSGARKVIAVDVGTDQMHPSLRNNPRVELHEKTDIRSLRLWNDEGRMKKGEKARHSSFVVLHAVPDVVVIDVSFISLREILPTVKELSSKGTLIIAMVKPQFEAGNDQLKHKGVIKNDRIRRDILKSFEAWAAERFIIEGKSDSHVAGAKGNLERFYKLCLLHSSS